MASEREIFSLSGPLNLTTVDWKNPDHRRSVLASLVRGVYILERDRHRERRGPQALARPWWDFFHFQLISKLVDDADRSVFGAIYEYKFLPPYCNCNENTPPRYVVAFRGNIIKPDTWLQDLKSDLQYIRNRLQQSPRFQLAMQAVQDMVARAGAANIWLAGHSLGSAIALLAGKNMVKMGFPIETYLFNPPFISAPKEQIKNKKLKHGIRFASSAIKSEIAAFVYDGQQRSQKHDSFVALSGWKPYLFVNPTDPFCAEYIGYFEHREKMVEFGAGEIERLATQNTLRSLFSAALGRDSEPSHLLPSAYLTINLNLSSSRSRDFKQAHGIDQWWKDFKQAHGIDQWWETDIQCQFKLHQFW